MAFFLRHLVCPLIPLWVLGACSSAPNPTDSGKDSETPTETGSETGSETGKETGETGSETGEAPLFSPLVAKDGRFWDLAGGEVILRGVNVAGSAKVPDFLPLNDMNDLDPLPDWGMNVIRLLFIWEAYETQEGVFDADYLAALTDIADAAGERGLRVILDFHQDGYSRFLANGCGDGFPQWSIPPGLSQDSPDNGAECALWPALVLADADVHSAFSDFYADTHGVRTAYLSLWSDLAAHFSTHPAVIGYDLFNEPWGWEATEISPLYEDAAAAIRTEHPEAILFIEGHASTNNGITQTLLSKPTFDNVAYAPHFYEAAVLGTHIWSGLSQGVEHGFSTMTAKANDWKVPLFVGEFGTHGDTVNAPAYLELHYDQLDAHLASAVQWNYTPKWTEQEKDGWNHEDLSIIDANGGLRDNFTPRPQPQRFAGTGLEFRADDRAVVVRWNNDPAAGETVFFLPAPTLWSTANPVLSPDGSNLECHYTLSDWRVRCVSDQNGEMKLTVTPN
jgi:endoglycosylceramidase